MDRDLEYQDEPADPRSYLPPIPDGKNWSVSLTFNVTSDEGIVTPEDAARFFAQWFVQTDHPVVLVREVPSNGVDEMYEVELGTYNVEKV